MLPSHPCARYLRPGSFLLLAAVIVLTTSASAFNGGSSKASAVALPISPPGSFVGDNTGLSSSPGASQHWNNVTWWTWTPSVTKTFAIRASSISPNGWDNTLEVWRGAGGAVSVTDNDDFYNLDAQVTFEATAGETYLIGLGAYQGGGSGTATLRFIEAPSAPQSVTASAASGTSVQISWSMPTANDESVTAYRIYRYINGVQNGGFATVSGAPPVTSYTMTGLTPGTTYTFAVAAVNSVGVSATSGHSAPVTLTGPPGAPTGVTATAGLAQATVAFTAPASDGGTPITSYTVTSSPGGLTATGSTSPLVVSGLANGTAYTFTVRATNAVGTGLASSASNAVTPARSPATPSNVVASAGDAHAVVAFAPGDTGGAPVTYTVVASPGGHHASATSSPIRLDGLQNGVSYTFVLYASNIAGVSAPSSPSNVVIPVGLCAVGFAHAEALLPSAGALGAVTLNAAPGCRWRVNSSASWLSITPLEGTGPALLTYVAHENPEATAREALLTAQSAQGAHVRVAQNGRGGYRHARLELAALLEGRTLRLTWPVPADAGVLDHVIEVGTQSSRQDLAVFNTGSGRGAYTLNDVPPGTYYMRVRAVYADGTSEPSNEVVVSVAVTNDVPSPPTELIPLPSAGSRVGVRWTRPALGEVSGYIAEFGSAPGLSDLARIEVSGTQLQWDSTVEPPFDFYVRVRAVNATGAGAASNELVMSRGQRSQSPPARPDAVNATYDSGVLNVVWGLPADGAQITAFVLEIGTLPGAANLVNTTLAPTSSSWSHAAPPGRYYVRMRSLNAAGVSTASSEVVVNSGTPATELPGMPQNLVADLTGDQLQLQWSPPADGGDLIEYVIEAGTAPGTSDVASVQTGSPHGAWSYVGVPSGRVFFIRVRARNAVGLGPASNEVRIGGE